MSNRVDKDSLQLDKPRRTPGHPTKSHIVKTKVDGKERIIRFGEQGASTAGKPKVGESERMTKKRASFKARHAKNIAKGKSSPAYWADKVKWNTGGSVELKNMLDDYESIDDVTHLVQKFKNGGQPKKAKEPSLLDYLESAANTVTSLPDLPSTIYQAGKRAVQSIPANVRSGVNYIQRSTPQQVMRDAQQTAGEIKGGLNRIVRHVKENPVETIIDVIPVVGDIKAYGEDVGRAARLRAQGDERGAANIEQYALPLAVASIIPGVGEARKAGKVANLVDAADDLSDVKQLTRKLITKPERGPVLPGPGETDILYRGAAPSEGRPQFIPERQRRGVTWFSNDPRVASEYAHTTNYDPELDGPTVTPVRLKTNSMMDVDAQGNTYAAIPLPDEYYDTRDVDDYAYDPADMYGEDTGGTLMSSTDKIAQLATDLGYDAVRMRNIIDYGPGADEAGRSRVADTYAAFDPSIVIPMVGRMNERKTNLDRFLKESIMKDEAGDPVVLFHGTSDDVTGNFNLHHPNRKDQGWLGRGAYVTDAPELASMYSSMKAGKAGANVMPLYGDIRNPYNMTLEEKNKLRFLSQGDIDDFTSKLRDAGHDSAIVTYPDGVREIAVFNPERQLKSASGNRGTYDPDNPDLKFAQGGLVSTYDEAIVNDLADKIREGIYG
jgi:hypothetical protein